MNKRKEVSKLRKIDVRIMEYLLDKQAKTGKEKTNKIELIRELKISERILNKAIKRLEKIFIKVNY